MKLSRRIQDLVRAGLASPWRLSGLGQGTSPARMEAQLEQIRKSLTGAAGREKQLQDALALAEEEGRERDTLRLRRELADLSRSKDELQAALDLIEARIEIKTEAVGKEKAGLRPSPATQPEAETPESAEDSAVDRGEEADLAARKTRLSAPEKGRGKP